MIKFTVGVITQKKKKKIRAGNDEQLHVAKQLPKKVIKNADQN